MKILTVVGARPQFVKAAVVSRELKNYKKFQEVIVHTGQHFDSNMSDIFFSELELTEPKYNLGVSAVSNTEMVSQIMSKLDKVISAEAPDLVLVYGDTNSTLAGAISAKQNNIPLAHIEAGMRSFNNKMAEELNRVITDRISDILFCSTEGAITNLVNEGFENLDCEMILSGDVMLDAALYYEKKAETRSNILSKLNLVKNKYVLATVHRAENIDKGNALKSIVKALNKVNKVIKVLLPLHPRARKKLNSINIKAEFTLIDPVGYLDMIQLTKNSKLVMTDSGGLQKEAFFFKKNCITLREETEWTELVKHGFNKLAGHNEIKILQAFKEMIEKNYVFKMNLYGNGGAGKKIVSFLNEMF